MRVGWYGGLGIVSVSEVSASLSKLPGLHSTNLPKLFKLMTDSKIIKIANREWFIITPGFTRGKCENPLAPNCGISDKILWIETKKKPGPYPAITLHVCKKCVKKDFNLVESYWINWEKEFKLEPKFNYEEYLKMKKNER